MCMRLKKGTTVTIKNQDDLKNCSPLLHAQINLKEDMEGVLSCKFIEENSDYIFIFSLDSNLPSEQYTLEINKNKISFSAGDTLGLMWGIYDFIENVLGVNPFRKFLELDYNKKEEIQIFSIELSHKPQYKYRGWFFNDEDYLTGWRTPAGKRPVDYLFYSNIMNHKTVDELAETILRNRLNLIIPSSFLDIDMPEDEENIRRVTERGLYVSQHHIEPLGVSHFALKGYLKRKGIEKEDISYITDCELYDEVWTHYVKKWAKYKNVIWQVGMRGKVDRPIWDDDPNVTGEEYAGKLISNVINHQLKIIKNVTGDEHPIVTMTLWEEGATLYRKGYLTIPDDIIVVFTDWPRTQLMKPDFHQITRSENGKYGVYHHTGSFCAGPHAVQGQMIDAMQNLFRLTEEKGDTDFIISNVQNLREVVYGAYCVSKYSMFGSSLSPESLLNDWCNHISPNNSKKLKEIYETFYSTYIINEWDDYTLEGITYWFDGFIRLAGLYAIDQYMKNEWHMDFATEKGRDSAYIKEMKICFDRWKTTAKTIKAYCDTLSGKEQTFVYDNLYAQAKTMEILSQWAYLINLSIDYDIKGNSKDAVLCAEEAVSVLENIFLILKSCEHDKFTGWYNNEDKFDYRSMLNTTTEMIGFFKTPVKERVYWSEATGKTGTYILNYKF